MINTEKEAFISFAERMISSMENNTYSACFLEINRQEGVTGFSTSYKDANGEEKYYTIRNGSEVCEVIRELYTIIQTQPPIHKDWNKAVFTLYPDGKVDMEYIWDAECQAKIDRYNAEAEAEKQKNRGK